MEKFFSDTDGLYGEARYFARQTPRRGRKKRFRGGILFDMVGDPFAWYYAFRQIHRRRWRTISFAAAEALKLRKYFSYLDRDLIERSRAAERDWGSDDRHHRFRLSPGGTPRMIRWTKLAQRVFKSSAFSSRLYYLVEFGFETGEACEIFRIAWRHFLSAG